MYIVALLPNFACMQVDTWIWLNAGPPSLSQTWPNLNPLKTTVGTPVASGELSEACRDCLYLPGSSAGFRMSHGGKKLHYFWFSSEIQKWTFYVFKRPQLQISSENPEVMFFASTRHSEACRDHRQTHAASVGFRKSSREDWSPKLEVFICNFQYLWGGVVVSRNWTLMDTKALLVCACMEEVCKLLPGLWMSRMCSAWEQYRSKNCKWKEEGKFPVFFPSSTKSAGHWMLWIKIKW